MDPDGGRGGSDPRPSPRENMPRSSKSPYATDELAEPEAPDSPFSEFGINAGFVEEIHENYQVDPQSVDESWRSTFDGFAPAPASVPPRPSGLERPSPAAPAPAVSALAVAAGPVAFPLPVASVASAPATAPGMPDSVAPRSARSAADSQPQLDSRLREADKNARVLRLIHSYRARGHRIANSDPLGDHSRYFPELDPAHYGFGNDDLDNLFAAGDLPGGSVQSLRDILDRLESTYCRSIGVEYTHVQDPGRKAWLQAQMERSANTPPVSPQQTRRIYEKLCAAELFEQFLHTKFLGQKRFSLEGGEVVIPLLDHIVESAPRHGIVEYVLGMSHRGRLNVLANVLGKPLVSIFSEFQDSPLLDLPFGSGDVKYHKGFSNDRRVESGERVHLTLTSNPSHLEAVDPVVEGRTKAKQMRLGDSEGERIVPIILHGDAAFAGQGIVAETLNLAQLEGYSTGGTLHIIINNQIGFTTTPSEARSTLYCSDVAKMIQIPIFHVNGDDPEAVLHCANLAMGYRERFSDDVLIDVVCYRRHGHNEGDEPSFTQPRLYAKIRSRASVKKLYGAHAVERGDLLQEAADEIEADIRKDLGEALEVAGAGGANLDESIEPEGPWRGFTRERPKEDPETGVPVEILNRVAEGVGTLPGYFRVHPKLQGLLDARRKSVADDVPLDWAMGEALAFGSLLLEGSRIRLSGQDSSRGTFSHRHAVFVDQDSGEEYTPLDNLGQNQARFEVRDSLLSEAAVLGFEYGYSVADPGTLTLWEAQFGDFANGAQVIIDQFITTAHVKWGRISGLVMLLPHGYEGQGPEHSSARIERYLQTCAEENIQVVNCTTPAQYFHVLRRQMNRQYRAPLVIFTPKSLLRARVATSALADFTRGRFQHVVDDAIAITAPDRVERVLLCSGKVYYDLLKERDERFGEDSGRVALVRLEQLYPWPGEPLSRVIERYGQAERIYWVQEEPGNMGPWFFVREHIQDILPPGSKLAYAGRLPSASTSVGSFRLHRQQQIELVEAAFAGIEVAGD